MHRRMPFFVLALLLSLTVLSACESVKELVSSEPQPIDEPAESCDPLGYTEAAVVPAGPLAKIRPSCPTADASRPTV